MDWSWFTTTLTAAGMVVLSAAAIYLAMLILTRVAGLRSFAKLSSFDFAVTVAIGSVIATTILAEDPPLLQATVALTSLYGLQMLVAVLRRRSDAAREAVDNAPRLLMAGRRVIRENLRAAQMTEADVRAKLREANVLDLDQVWAVVMEATGDVSVIHGDPDGPPLNPELLSGVRDSDRLADEPSARS